MKNLLLLFIAIIFLSCNSSSTNGEKQESQKSQIDSALTKQNLSDTDNTNGVVGYDSSKDKPGLDVVVLPTDNATAQEPDDPADTIDHFRYPARLTIAQSSVDSLKSIADAYGCAHTLWLGPKGWKGSGLIATNGGRGVNIYPPGEEDMKGARVMYSTEPSCQGCIFTRAAPYFKELKEDYERDYNSDGTNPITLPAGIIMKRVSSSIVTYTLPDKDGLSSCGVAFYGTGTNNPDDDKYFTEALFVLPTGQTELMNALLKWYVDKMSRLD